MSHRPNNDHGQRDRPMHEHPAAADWAREAPPRPTHPHAVRHPAERQLDYRAEHRGDHYADHRHGHPLGFDERRPRPEDEPRRPRPPARAPAQAAARPTAQGTTSTPRRSFTFGYAGRLVRLGPVAFWTVVGSLVIMAGWSAVTATYFAFHDDVITRMIARQAEVQAAYEDRITEMRAQVDRVTTRQLLDQEQFEQKLEQVIRRQSVLENRAAALGGIGGGGAPEITGSIKPPGRNLPAEPVAAPPKASPISDTVIFRAPPDRQARLESRQPATALAAASRNVLPGLEGKIARLNSALDRIETRQTAALATLEENYDGRARRIRAMLSDLGLERTAPAESNVGGPFVPVRLASVASTFERQVHRVRLARVQAERLTRTLVSIPIRKPVAGEVDFSSTFGVRLDPFLGRPAMHTGLDFRGTTGEPIRVTANGTVTSAGWSGGYGRMIEVDHGNGLSTRYGHLSEILVQPGQSVKTGQVIGKLGSTGRSTGPHLHYETRVAGDAIDPQKFLRAGLRMGAL